MPLPTKHMNDNIEALNWMSAKYNVKVEMLTKAGLGIHLLKFIIKITILFYYCISANIIGVVPILYRY